MKGYLPIPIGCFDRKVRCAFVCWRKNSREGEKSFFCGGFMILWCFLVVKKRGEFVVNAW